MSLVIIKVGWWVSFSYLLSSDLHLPPEHKWLCSGEVLCFKTELLFQNQTSPISGVTTQRNLQYLSFSLISWTLSSWRYRIMLLEGLLVISRQNCRTQQVWLHSVNCHSWQSALCPMLYILNMSICIIHLKAGCWSTERSRQSCRRILWMSVAVC